MRARFAVLTALLVGSLSLAGCGFLSDLFSQRAQPLLPAADLYAAGEAELSRKRYEDARVNFRKIVERHPQSNYAARARFLVGEAFYREGEFNKAISEFEAFLAFFPRHEIADLVQFRLAMSYYDQMKPVEQDQGITKKAEEQFRKLVRDYPDSRYASDALSKIERCRGQLAQKEVWVAAWYLDKGNRVAARQRLESVVKDYARSLVIPEALFRLGEIYAADGRAQDAQTTWQRLAGEYPYTEWGRRASQRLRTAAR